MRNSLDTLLRNAKRRVRFGVNEIRKQVFAFGPDELQSAIATLVSPGGVVFVHVGFDRLHGFTGRPTDILRVLRAVIGSDGTILMPSMAFTGSAIDYVRGGERFDVRRTPSRMGLVTELFRRQDGTLRSDHPTHAVLANGPRAAELLAGHAEARTPCGLPSPYAKLAAADAQILLLGPGVEVLTYFHYFEELLEPRMPFSPFTAEVFSVSFCDSLGVTRTTTMRLLDPNWSRRRRLSILEEGLRRRGAWRTERVGMSRISLMRALDVESTLIAMAECGKFAYE